MKFVKRKPLSADMTLQITSMADIFMILLVFLLKNYSASVTNLSPSSKTRLPVAASDAAPKEGLKLEIAPDAILVDQKPVVKLTDFTFQPGDLPESGATGPLHKVLLAQRLKPEKKDAESSLVVFADERAPYATVKRVLASAASSGYVDLQLVVVQSQ